MDSDLIPAMNEVLAGRVFVSRLSSMDIGFVTFDPGGSTDWWTSFRARRCPAEQILKLAPDCLS
jgi:hypothetical protein